MSHAALITGPRSALVSSSTTGFPRAIKPLTTKSQNISVKANRANSKSKNNRDDIGYFKSISLLHMFFLLKNV
ncbi:hypothetical protein PENTCL1PPCAC_25841, partial [Pristionchus entomophagus]